MGCGVWGVGESGSWGREGESGTGRVLHLVTIGSTVKFLQVTFCELINDSF